MDAPRNGRYLSTDSSKVDEPFKVEEAETVNIPPPLTEKVLSCCEDYRTVIPSIFSFYPSLSHYIFFNLYDS